MKILFCLFSTRYSFSVENGIVLAGLLATFLLLKTTKKQHSHEHFYADFKREIMRA